MPILHRLSFSISRIGLFWQEKINGLVFRWTVFFILVQVVLLFFKFSDLPPQIPLYYSQPWGESQLAPASSIFILPALSLFVLLLNNILAVFFLKSVQLLSRFLIITSLVFSFLSAIAVYQIIWLIS
jgi:hypothetical protein